MPRRLDYSVGPLSGQPNMKDRRRPQRITIAQLSAGRRHPGQPRRGLPAPGPLDQGRRTSRSLKCTLLPAPGWRNGWIIDLRAERARLPGAPAQAPSSSTIRVLPVNLTRVRERARCRQDDEPGGPAAPASMRAAGPRLFRLRVVARAARRASISTCESVCSSAAGRPARRPVHLALGEGACWRTRSQAAEARSWGQGVDRAGGASRSRARETRCRRQPRRACPSSTRPVFRRSATSLKARAGSLGLDAVTRLDALPRATLAIPHLSAPV